MGSFVGFEFVSTTLGRSANRIVIKQPFILRTNSIPLINYFLLLFLLGARRGATWKEKMI